MNKPSPQILVLCKDLLFSSQLNGAVQRAGFQPQTCLGMKTCLQGLKDYEILAVVIDLELSPLDLMSLREAAGAGCRLIAFGPHVHVELLRSAKEAGCNFVLTRGQIASELERVLTAQI